MLAPLRRAGKTLEAAVGRGPVSGHGNDVHILPAMALVDMAQSGKERGSVIQQRNMHRDFHAAVIVPAYHAAAGHTSGGNADNGVLPGDLKDAAKHQLAAAALASGHARRHHIRLLCSSRVYLLSPA